MPTTSLRIETVLRCGNGKRFIEVRIESLNNVEITRKFLPFRLDFFYFFPSPLCSFMLCAILWIFDGMNKKLFLLRLRPYKNVPPTPSSVHRHISSKRGAVGKEPERTYRSMGKCEAERERKWKFYSNSNYIFSLGEMKSVFCCSRQDFIAFHSFSFAPTALPTLPRHDDEKFFRGENVLGDSNQVRGWARILECSFNR